MTTYVVICTFRSDTVMDEVFAVLADEQAQVRVLQNEGRLGTLHISLERGTVFLEILAEDPAAAEATVRSLPMSRWWDLDIFPIAPPATPGGGG